MPTNITHSVSFREMPKDAATIFSRRTLYNMVAFQVSTNVAIGVCVQVCVCTWRLENCKASSAIVAHLIC